MRRTLILLAFLCIIVGTATSQVRFGIKGGANLSELYFKSSGFESKHCIGFFAGPTVRIPFRGTALSVDLSALYDQRRVEVEDRGETVRHFIFPLNLRCSFGLGRLIDLFLFAGPQVAFKFDNGLSSDFVHNKWDWRSSSFSANFGAGLSLCRNVDFSLGYNLALGKTGRLSSSRYAGDYSNADVRANAWHAGLTVYL